MSHHKRNEASFLKSSAPCRIFEVNSDRPSGGEFQLKRWRQFTMTNSDLLDEAKSTSTGIEFVAGTEASASLHFLASRFTT